MDPVDIARWQFGITTVYHFLMVPLTIGLGLTVALMQTMWYRTGHEHYLRMTKFWGKLFLINFIMGVATGIVQEFQFGMAWSEYSRFVGDVFGAPLAMEALLAFFVESTFLGLWIFGWTRLPKGVHLATLWAAVGASVLSAYFIIVANSWMQHPVGVELVDGRPRMVDAWAVFTNNTALIAFQHVILGATAVAGSFLVGISWYHLWKRRRAGMDATDAQGSVIHNASHLPGRDEIDNRVWIRSLRIGAVVSVIAFVGLTITGDFQGKLMYEQQPMKMASAEAACQSGSDFSILTIANPGSNDCGDVQPLIVIPGLLSFLANGTFGTTVPGVMDLLPQYQEQYGTNLPDNPIYGDRAGQEIDYQPLMIVTYWGFRLMIGLGMLAALISAVAFWLSRKGTVPLSRWLMRIAVAAMLLPFAANIAGWIFTEMGRQPFVVAPNPDPSGVDGVFMYVAAAVSPGVSATEMLVSLIALTAIYAVLLVVEVLLLTRYVRGGVASAMPELAEQPSDAEATDRQDEDVLAFAY
jgi:cytochrome d ubiquinol oxidase subunit I